MNPIAKDPLQRKVEVLNWITLGLLTTISLMFFSGEFTLGVLLGGLISVISFSWRQRDLRKVFRNLTDRSKSVIMIRYYIRFLISAVLIYLIISRTSADVIGLLVGLSIVIINIVVTLLAGLVKKPDSAGVTDEEENQAPPPGA